MDLLEIRKKAKEKKEAEKKAALEAGKEAASQAEPGRPEEPARADAPAPGPRKAPRKKKPKAAGEKAARKPRKKTPAVTTGVEQADAGAEPAEKTAAEAEIVAAPEATAKEQSAVKEPAPDTEVPEEDLSGTEESQAEEAPVDGEEAEEQDGTIIEYLAFMLADEEYAVKVEDVKEIIRLQRTTKVPRAEDFVEGIISLRGVIIPVFDIRKRLGLERTEHGRTARIVIVSENGSPQGIIVDKVTGVARLIEKAIEPPPAVIGGVEAEYLEGVGRIGDRLLILFNTGKVLAMDKETGA